MSPPTAWSVEAKSTTATDRTFLPTGAIIMMWSRRDVPREKRRADRRTAGQALGRAPAPGEVGGAGPQEPDPPGRGAVDHVLPSARDRRRGAGGAAGEPARVARLRPRDHRDSRPAARPVGADPRA